MDFGEAVSYATELIDPWAKDPEKNEVINQAHALQEESAKLKYGDAFTEAAEQLGLYGAVQDILEVANFLMENPEYMGKSDDEVREAMGELAPYTL